MTGAKLENLDKLLERAEVLHRENRIHNALDVLNIILQTEPRYGMAHALLATIYESIGDIQSALKSLRKAVQYGYPKDSAYEKLLLYWAYCQKHHTSPGYTDIKEYINNNPQYLYYNIGNYSYCPNQSIDIGDWSTGQTLSIGKFCSIASCVSILLGGEHSLKSISTYTFKIGFNDYTHYNDCLSKGDVNIGNDVWIGYGATILSGVRIGDGAAVGARSVVTKDVEAYSIVAGNPARKVGSRFPDEVASRLLKIRWWDWEIDKIRKNIPLLVEPSRMEEFLAIHSGGD